MAAPIWEDTSTPKSGVGAVTPLRSEVGTIASTDILLLFVESADSPVATPSGGWALVGDSPQHAGGGSLATQTGLWIFWVRGDPGADPTIADPGNHLLAILARISGCETTGDPWDVTAGDTEASGSTTVTIPGDTTTVNDCLIVAAATSGFDGLTDQFDSWANASLTSFGEVLDVHTDAGNGGQIGVATGVKATAGAVSATTATLANSSKQGRIMIALKPPAAVSNDRAGRVSWAEMELPNAPRQGRISWAELEVPNAPRQARVSWAEMEVPNAPRQGRISWAEMEVPTAPRRGQVSWAELEVPDAPTTDRRGQVSWSELELPNAPRFAQVSWAELEVPNAPRQARISWAELEVPTAPRFGAISWAELELPDAPTDREGRISWAELEVPTAPGTGRAVFIDGHVW